MTIQNVLHEMREAADGMDNAGYHESARETDRWVREIEAAMREPVAWRTDDYLTDKSATTYEPEIARHWVRKGWEVDPLYEVPPDAQSEIKALREALQAAVDCGMVPTSSAKEGGAARHSIQVRVADMIRAAIALNPTP